MQMKDSPVLQPLVLSAPAASVSAPPGGLNERFFFNYLVVRLPYSWIFWQFLLFLVFKFVVVLLLVVQGGKVYLPTPPSWPEVLFLFFDIGLYSCDFSS